MVLFEVFSRTFSTQGKWEKIESWGLWVDTTYFILLLHKRKAVILLNTLA